MSKASPRMSERWRKRTVELFWGMVLVTAIALGLYLLESAHITFPIEILGKDAFLASGTQESDIRLVGITDEDYDCPALFDGRSPLRRDLVMRLINKLAAANPRRIIVDLDLSDPEPSEIPKLESADRQASTGNSSSALETKATDYDCSNRALFARKAVPLRLSPGVAVTFAEGTRQSGGKPHFPILRRFIKPAVALPDGRPCEGDLPAGCREAQEALSAAVSIFPYDWDHKVRSYMTKVKVSEPGVPNFCPVLPTLAAMGRPKGDLTGTQATAAEENADTTCTEHQPEEPKFINFSRSRNAFATVDAASLLMTDAGDDPQSSNLKNVYEDKIVVIGGNFSAARDRYWTPVGELPGMTLVALSIQSEHDKSGIGEVTRWHTFLVDLLLGTVLVSLGVFLGGWRGVVACIVAGLFLPLAGSLLLFQTYSLYLNFMPICVGAILHVSYDAIYDRGRRKGEEEAKKKLAAAHAEQETLGGE